MRTIVVTLLFAALLPAVLSARGDSGAEVGEASTAAAR